MSSHRSIIPGFINLKPFTHFLKSGSSGGIILFGCVIVSLLIANSAFGSQWESLLLTEIGGNIFSLHLKYPILQWINDGLMAIFFLLVGLEIKRELIEGELSSFSKASLPVIAAIGGACLPALIYFLINKDESTRGGWGIPMATDIAFALAVIMLLGKRVPTSLKIFLSALAIADDLLAILVIAVFYSSDIIFMNLIYAGGVFVVLVLFNYFGVKRLVFYLIPGVCMWYFIHHSGIHATIAGVLTAFTLPTTEDAVESPLEKLEHILFKPVNFIIMPLFALANTNIRIDMSMITEGITPMTMGIMCGLLIGKPVGITLVSWLSVKSGISSLPENVRWAHIIGAGILGGIGFTMSVFITLLSFRENPMYLAEAKIYILITSLLAGICGFVWLLFVKEIKPAIKESF